MRGRHQIAKCVLFCSAFLTGCSVEEVGSQTENIVDPSLADDYPEAVIVNALGTETERASCSGVLIRPRVVLTAGHCVDGFGFWGVSAPNADEQWTTSFDAITYDWNVGMTFTFDQHDVALVFLEDPIELDTYPVVSADPHPDGDPIVTIGRVNKGNVTNDWLFVSGEVDIFHSLQGHDHPHHYGSLIAKVQKGDSGGPAIVPGTYPHVIVGLNSSMRYFARLDQVHGWITDEIAVRGLD